MKKKFLLTFLPAFLILSACNGGLKQNKENNENVPDEVSEANGDFEEDTLAHEELFGGLGIQSYSLGQSESLQPKKAFLNERLAEPVNPLTTPQIGVQFRKYSVTYNPGQWNESVVDYYAIRYVAAIASLSVTATWTRDISDVYGLRPRDGQSLQVPIKTAYSAVSSGDDETGDTYTTPESVGSDYHFFVVFTLRQIPMDKVNSYLYAYLTLTSLDGSSSVESRARVSKVGGHSNDDSFTIPSPSSEGVTPSIVP